MFIEQALGAVVASGSGKLRHAKFTASGTFTPSTELLALGGVCGYFLVGGGGGGEGTVAGSGLLYGGDGGEVKTGFVTITAAQAISIGAAGAGGIAGGAAPTDGGASSIGSLVSAAGGLRANVAYGHGKGSGGPYLQVYNGNVAIAGGAGSYGGFGAGGGGGVNNALMGSGGSLWAGDGTVGAAGKSAIANTGCGGGAGVGTGGTGGTGLLVLWWVEA